MQRSSRRSGRPRRGRPAGLLALLLGLGVLAAVAVSLAAGGGGHGPRTAPSAAGVRPSPALEHRQAAAAGAAESAELRRLVRIGRPIYCAGRRGNEVALTFDDGPGPYTRLALRKLRRHGIRATFFVVGRNLPLIPGITRAERAIGAVGDHTFTHPLLTALAPALAESEMARTQRDLARASGGPVTLFRPPYGGRNPTIDAIAQRLGMVEILWTVDSADSLGADYAGIARNVIAGLHPGAIVLMHENRGQTIRAMLTILPAVARAHLRAVSVPRLLADDPPSAAQLRAGPNGCGRPVRASGGS